MSFPYQPPTRAVNLTQASSLPTPFNLFWETKGSPWIHVFSYFCPNIIRHIGILISYAYLKGGYHRPFTCWSSRVHLSVFFVFVVFVARRLVHKYNIILLSLCLSSRSHAPVGPPGEKQYRALCTSLCTFLILLAFVWGQRHIRSHAYWSACVCLRSHGPVGPPRPPAAPVPLKRNARSRPRWCAPWEPHHHRSTRYTGERSGGLRCVCV